MSGAIPSWAKVGANVVCVDDSGFDPEWGNWGGAYPQAGQVYTIAGLASNFPGIELEEVPPTNGGSAAWMFSRFRPVKTIEDDISEHFAIFLSTPAPQPVEMAS